LCRLRSRWADGFELLIARDDRVNCERWLKKGLAVDVLLLSGGVSAGKFDLVPEVLAAPVLKKCFTRRAPARQAALVWCEGLRRSADIGVWPTGKSRQQFRLFRVVCALAIAALGSRLRYNQSGLCKTVMPSIISGGRAALPAGKDPC
jgi:hypothetical protein